MSELLKGAFLTCLFLLFFATASMAQTVTVDYLYPGLGTGDPYRYVRFGNSSQYWAGFMWNNTHTAYGDGNDFTIFTYGNRDLALRAGYGDIILHPQASSGYVGIGTKNPTSRLTVNGTTNTEEVIVTEDTGADFVFEDDYKLTSLPELEQYIKSNKHLPEIPSAQEMITNGVRVGELQMKLLQKIEELTLHVIKLEKKIKEFKQ